MIKSNSSLFILINKGTNSKKEVCNNCNKKWCLIPKTSKKNSCLELSKQTKQFCNDCKLKQETETENTETGHHTKQLGCLELQKVDPDLIMNSTINEGSNQKKRNQNTPDTSSHENIKPTKKAKKIES